MASENISTNNITSTDLEAIRDDAIATGGGGGGDTGLIYTYDLTVATWTVSFKYINYGYVNDGLQHGAIDPTPNVTLGSGQEMLLGNCSFGTYFTPDTFTYLITSTTGHPSLTEEAIFKTLRLTEGASTTDIAFSGMTTNQSIVSGVYRTRLQISLNDPGWAVDDVITIELRSD